MKRLFFLIAVFTAILCLFTLTSSAAPTSGQCGPDVTWKLKYNGNLYISGSGPMYDYAKGSEAPWAVHNPDITYITIDSGVTTIGSHAFEGLACVGYVEMGSVETIGDYAFFLCPSLWKVGFSNSLKSIGDYAFSSCASLCDITFPNYMRPSSLQHIGENAFSASGLEAIELPNSVTSIGFSAFSACVKLEKAVLGSGLSSIPTGAFAECKKLKTLTLHNTISSVERNAFTNCFALTEINYFGTYWDWRELSKNGNSALSNAKVHYMTVTYSQNSCFDHTVEYYCDTCKRTEDFGDIWPYCTDYNGDERCDVCGGVTEPRGDCGDHVKYHLPRDGSLRLTGSGAMYDYSPYNKPPWCDWGVTINDVYIDGGITELGDYVLSSKAEGFYCTVELENVYFYGTKSQWDALKKGSNNDLLQGAKIHYLTAVYTANGDLTHDRVYACSSCAARVGLQTEACVDESHDFFCDNCGQDYGEVIVARGDRGQWEINGRNELTVFYVDGYGSDFFGLRGNWNETITKVTFEEGMAAIWEFAFEDYTALTTVSLPETMRYIGRCAFENCTALREINLPNSLETIEYSAFLNCKSLTSVTIPASVESLGGYTFPAFYGSGLTSVCISEGVEKIWDSAFSGCGALTSVTMPQSTREIGKAAFSSCKSLSDVNIPEGVEKIGERAFSYCTSLTAIRIPKNVSEIGDLAFYNEGNYSVALEFCGGIPKGIGDPLWYGAVVYRKPGPLYDHASGTVQENHPSYWCGRTMEVKLGLLDNMAITNGQSRPLYAAVYDNGKMIELAQTEAVVDQVNTVKTTYYVCDFEKELPKDAVVKFFYLDEGFAPTAAAAVYP